MILRRLGWVWVVALALLAPAARAAGTPQPAIPAAKAGTQCVAPPGEMRREHMNMLKHQRDETVHRGIRGAKASLNACIQCHAGAATGSVARAPDDFCVGCHRYAAVRIDCFECHASTPKGTPSAFHVPLGADGRTPLAQSMRQQVRALAGEPLRSPVGAAVIRSLLP